MQIENEIDFILEEDEENSLDLHGFDLFYDSSDLESETLEEKKELDIDENNDGYSDSEADSDFSLDLDKLAMLPESESESEYVIDEKTEEEISIDFKGYH